MKSEKNDYFFSFSSSFSRPTTGVVFSCCQFLKNNRCFFTYTFVMACTLETSARQRASSSIMFCKIVVGWDPQPHPDISQTTAIETTYCCPLQMLSAVFRRMVRVFVISIPHVSAVAFPKN
jgi:hypothetical protein